MQRDMFQCALKIRSGMLNSPSDGSERILCEFPQWTSEWDWIGAEILDIGSRFGHRTSSLHEKLAPLRIDRIRGVEADINAVEFAIKNFAHENLDFLYVTDFEDRFPLKFSNTFDWVLHINPTLFHLNNQEAVLRNFLWCLKPGGKALIALPTELPLDVSAVTEKIFLKSASKELNQWMKESLDVKKKAWFNHPQADKIYALAVEKCGFNIHRTKLLDFPYTFANKNEHRAALETFFHDAIMFYPEDQRDSLLSRMFKMARSKIKKNHWKFRFMLIFASRPDLSCSVCGCKPVARIDEDERPLIPDTEPPETFDSGEDVKELIVEVIHNDSDDDVSLENETEENLRGEDSNQDNEGTVQAIELPNMAEAETGEIS